MYMYIYIFICLFFPLTIPPCADIDSGLFEERVLAVLSEGPGPLSEPLEVARFLADRGFSCRVRKGLGDSGVDMLSSLRHTFVEVREDTSPALAGASDHILMVDPSFRSQFEILNAPAWYQSLVALVPATLVATPEVVDGMVRSLCEQSKLAYTEMGAVVPPWRKLDAQLSKWFPKRSTDLCISWCLDGIVQLEQLTISGGADEDMEEDRELQGTSPSTAAGGAAYNAFPSFAYAYGQQHPQPPQPPQGQGGWGGPPSDMVRRSASPYPAGANTASTSMLQFEKIDLEGAGAGYQFSRPGSTLEGTSPTLTPRTGSVAGASPRSLLKELLGASPTISPYGSPPPGPGGAGATLASKLRTVGPASGGHGHVRALDET